jgi:hypothetical protein
VDPLLLTMIMLTALVNFASLRYSHVAHMDLAIVLRQLRRTMPEQIQVNCIEKLVNKHISKMRSSK